jgi:hypothetical protein
MQYFYNFPLVISGRISLKLSQNHFHMPIWQNLNWEFKRKCFLPLPAPIEPPEAIFLFADGIHPTEKPTFRLCDG